MIYKGTSFNTTWINSLSLEEFSKAMKTYHPKFSKKEVEQLHDLSKKTSVTGSVQSGITEGTKLRLGSGPVVSRARPK